MITQRQRADKTIYISHLCRLIKSSLIQRIAVKGNIVGKSITEDETLLHHRSCHAAPKMRIYGSQRQITHLDASMVRLIKTLQELDKRGLATAALSTIAVTLRSGISRLTSLRA